MMRLFGALDRLVAIACKVAAIACLLGLFVLLALAIVLRLLPLFTIPGYDELVELLFIWLVMLTSLALWREGVLYRVMLFEDLMPAAAKRLVEIAINLAMLGFALVLVVYGWDFAQNSGETTPFLRLDKAWFYGAIPACAALMAVYSLVWLWRVATGRGALESSATLAG
ncbi:MAG: TRAP transporter small permease subunit [Bosea sp. (in: a-proteobacteria)]|uniref:TRAP transporter small permease n=1 Tax=Bosea sp. (in: a-proteobacteria) TaxID=1871050 RepID=UPI002734AD2A|nr:TRAP transporter small permease subunit [Bosea sp. (in: a-proteobacteria)]MDP3254635.1 TRAP transporter small permease subunit [Bosea sp. (in: a-proteobacteria)]MDP3319790.1 TRAP transporter small permease subunit [Bosea sp. (in: a-proteobacteria)]